MSNKVLWSKVTTLKHLTKSEYCATSQTRQRCNAIVEKWCKENPNPSVEDEMNFKRLLLLEMQIDSISNNKVLMDGTRLDSGHISEEDFFDHKMKERQLLPKLQAEFDKALSKTGKTGQQKKISEDIKTSAEAAALVYQKHRSDGDNQ